MRTRAPGPDGSVRTAPQRRLPRAATPEMAWRRTARTSSSRDRLRWPRAARSHPQLQRGPGGGIPTLSPARIRRTSRLLSPAGSFRIADFGLRNVTEGVLAHDLSSPIRNPQSPIRNYIVPPCAPPFSSYCFQPAHSRRKPRPTFPSATGPLLSSSTSSLRAAWPTRRRSVARSKSSKSCARSKRSTATS